MKTIKSLKAVFIMFGFAAMVSSCKKDSFESAEPLQATNSQPSTDQQNDPAEPGNGEREMGCILLSPVEYNKLPKAPESLAIQSLPSTFSLTCPAIKNQGGEGSCVGFGTAYAARSIIERNFTGGSFSNSINVFSPEYVYNQIKVSSDCTKGAYVSDALDMMCLLPDILATNKGVCTWAKMPYSSTNGCSVMPNSTQINDAANHVLVGWGTISITASNIKNTLYAGHPVIVAGPVDVAFQNLGSQNYTSYNSSQKTGDHCYCVVGWNATRNAFKVMNSWGTTWGDNGYGWIHYSLVSTMFKNAYIMY